jgi:putative pyruvate formate lyase activating enzyme
LTLTVLKHILQFDNGYHFVFIMYTPCYIQLYKSGELEKRVNLLKARLHRCNICPRECGIDRFESNKGFCRSGHLALVSSYCDHHGEEPVLSGSRGSGTTFFQNCNLKCIYCQNYQISQSTDMSFDEVEPVALAKIMLHLQNDLHCHNINLVSPSHFIPQIVEAIYHAVPLGLKIPLIYNTNAYDALATLKLLRGIIDIYLPDIKYASDTWAIKFSQAKNYVAISRAAIHEMYNQVGDLIVDPSGIALRGLIVRHLILPNNIAGSEDSLNWLAKKVSRNVTVSIMSQYHPCHLAFQQPLLARHITRKEYDEVISITSRLGLESGWLQAMDSAETYLPDFNREGHPFSIS